MATPSPEDLIHFHSVENGSKDSRIGLILAVEIPLITLVLLTVCLRFYARTFVTKALGKDDWVMALSALIAFSNTVINCVTTKYGQGVHVWNLDYKLIPAASKLGWTYQVMFPPAVTLCKISIVLTYLRIFTTRRDRIFCFGTLTYLSLYGVIITLTIAFQCIPVNSYWDLSIKNKRCYDQNSAMIIFSALNTVSDLIVFMWPAPKIFQLKLPIQQRLGLMFVFSLGCVACIAGLARMWYYPKFFSDKDVLYAAALLSVLANVECNISIICGSLPEIRPLLVRWFGKWKPGSSRSEPYQTSRPRSNPTPHHQTSFSTGPGGPAATKQGMSSDSLDQVHDWDLEKSPPHVATESFYLEDLPKQNKTRKW
ncbi:hypothetical protein E2P81_ATG11606 [Venturia nashicola]|nr:hypothetical protein E2P81_ATG11606 [Venturia nashicola]